MVRATKAPLLLYNQNRKVKFSQNPYSFRENALIDEENNFSKPIIFPLKIGGEIIFVWVRLARWCNNYLIWYFKHVGYYI